MEMSKRKKQEAVQRDLGEGTQWIFQDKEREHIGCQRAKGTSNPTNPRVVERDAQTDGKNNVLSRQLWVTRKHYKGRFGKWGHFAEGRHQETK